jgi:hypothetical protein
MADTSSWQLAERGTLPGTLDRNGPPGLARPTHAPPPAPGGTVDDELFPPPLERYNADGIPLPPEEDAELAAALREFAEARAELDELRRHG